MDPSTQTHEITRQQYRERQPVYSRLMREIKFAAENPDLFKFGTDFITKSLGFVDVDFRQKHYFGDRTPNAFDHYADKVDRKHENA
jgi:hypothetical protein